MFAGKQKKPSKVLVFLSYFLPVVAGLVVGFFLPKILGVDGYGFYKIFNLYTDYMVLLSFGFVSGIYLKYGGTDLDQLDKEKFRTYFRFFAGFQGFFCLSGCLLTVFLAPEPYKLIFIFVFLYQFAYNVFYFFDIVSTICQLYLTMIIRNCIQAVLSVISIVVLFLIRDKGVVLYEVYIALFVVSYFVYLILYIVEYKDFVFGRSAKLSAVKKDLFALFASGLPLMLSDLVSSLIFLVDRQVVSLYFDISTYSVYSFAYSILHIFTLVLYSLSALVYPSLKRMDKNNLKPKYEESTRLVLIFSIGALASFFVLFYVITYWFPAYVGAIEIYQYVILSLPFNCLISIVVYSFYKTYEMQNNFLIKSILILALSIGADIGCYYIFRNTLCIVISSLFVCLLWYVITDIYFVKKYQISVLKNSIYFFVLVCVYVLCIFYLEPWLGLVIFLSVYLLLTVLFYYQFLKKLILNLKTKRKAEPIIVSDENDTK